MVEGGSLKLLECQSYVFNDIVVGAVADVAVGAVALLALPFLASVVEDLSTPAPFDLAFLASSSAVARSHSCTVTLGVVLVLGIFSVAFVGMAVFFLCGIFSATPVKLCFVSACSKNFCAGVD